MSRTAVQPPVDQTFRALITAFGMCRRVMDGYFSQYGISGSQWGVLQSLRRAHDEEGLSSIRLTDLSERLIVRPPSVTGAVDRLQRMGLVARNASAKDLRAKEVSLTPAGRRLIRKVWRGHRAHVDNVLAGLDADERQDLQRLLVRLNAHLKDLVDPSEMHVSSRKIAPSNGNHTVRNTDRNAGQESQTRKAESI